MDFISNSSEQCEEMLKVIEVSSIDELFSSIPDSLRLPKPDEEDGLSEMEGKKMMEEIASQNTFSRYDSYLGAGAYSHYIPAMVSAICSKSEFLTSYTPYQPEASQGMLQAIFEFQSAICALTGMDVSNASLYDAASACGEGALMALRLQKPKSKILMAASVHPHYKAVVRQYCEMSATLIEEVPFLESGELDTKFLNGALNDETAFFLLQSPNFFGIMESSKEIFSEVHKKGALAILCANPLSYGIYKSAQEVNADIAVGDCQPFGLSVNYGGPYAGYISCKEEFLRQLPGRIVGETKDINGKRGFVLTLQAREQHIRREKATSNICTNQALAALASLTAMLWYGKHGVAKLALTNFQRAAYLRQQISSIQGVKIFGNGSHFNEFAFETKRPIEDLIQHFKSENILPGVPLKSWYPTLAHSLLVCVTELKTKKQIDHYVKVLKKFYGNNI